MKDSLRCAAGSNSVFLPHSHTVYEITFIDRGEGEYRIGDTVYSVQAGTVVVVPPYSVHSSVITGDVNRIWLQGRFDSMLPPETPLVFRDNGECRQLIELLYHNRFGPENYMAALSNAYVQCIATHWHPEHTVQQTVRQLVRCISEHGCDAQFNVTEALRDCGYAPDYLRACFKEMMGQTPSAFLNEVRIRNACFLIEIYRRTVPLSQVAEQCGYTDYVHFSKKFKEITGCSPRCFLNEHSG